MKLFASLLALSLNVLPPFIAQAAVIVQPTADSSIVGVWKGFATVGESQQIPITIRMSGLGAGLVVEFLNGPAARPDATTASSAIFDGKHFIASFDYFARALDATLVEGRLDGTYGPAYATAKSAPPIPF